MNIIDIIIILYLVLTLLISFVISYLYLNYFRNKKLTSCFTFYSCAFFFGLIIYLIFLVSLDHAISFDTKIEDKSILIKDLLNILEIYYEYLGFLFKFVRYIFAPIMIFAYTTGFYNKCDIFLDVFIRVLSKKIFTKFNICLIIVLLIPIFVLLYLGKLYYFYENEVKLILNYLNYYSYLRILFYIGFIIQNYIRMFLLKKDKGENENYNIWKLGKLYMYYEREKITIKKNYDLIKKEIEEYDKKHPKEINEYFKRNAKRFEDYVKFSLQNIIYLEPDIEGIKYSTEKYKKEYRNEDIEAEKLFGLNNNNENMDNINEENIEFNRDNDIDHDNEFNFLDKNYEKHKYNCLQEEKKNNNIGFCSGWISCNYCICCSCCCKRCNCCKRNQEYKNFKEFKNTICLLMDEVYELCASIQRKSFLINEKYKDICYEEKKELENNCSDCFLKFCSDCSKLCTWLMLILFLFYVEFPIEIDIIKAKKGEYILNFYIWIIFFISLITFFLIFNYSIVHHQHTEGDIIYGKKMSQNVNYYNFISLMVDLINALLFHSVWVLNKSQKIEAKFSKVFILKPIKNNGINIIPYISITIIIISIYNTVTFSKIKMCEKNIVIFNENADFFGFEENFYGNFYIGCGCLIFITKNGIIKRKPDIGHIEISENEENEENEKETSLLENNNNINNSVL